MRHLLYENEQLQKEKAELIEKVQELIMELSSIKSIEKRTTLTITSPKAELESFIESVRERSKKKCRIMEEKYTGQMDALNQQIRDQQVEIGRISEREANLKDKIASQAKEIETLKWTYEQRIHELNQKLTQSDSETKKVIAELRAENQRIEAERSNTTSQMIKEKSAMQDDYLALLAKKNELEALVDKLNQNLTQREDEWSQNQQQLQAAWEKENSKYQEMLNEVRKENNKLKEDLRQRDEANAELKGKIEEMKRDREKLTKTIEEKTEMITISTKQMEQTKEATENEKNQLKSEIENYKSELQRKVTETSQLKTQIEALTSASKTRETEMEDKLNRTIQEKNQQMVTLTSEVEKTTEQYRGYEAKLQELSREVSKLTEEITSRDSRIAEQEMTIKKLTEKQSKLEAENERVHNFEQQISLNTTDLVTTLKNFQGLLHPDTVFSEQDEKELDVTARLVKEMTILREMFVSSYKDVEQLIQDKSQFMRQSSELEKLLDEAKRKVQSTSNELATLKIRLETTLEELTTIKYENDLFAVERQNFTDAISKMRASLQMLKSSLQESEREKKELKDRLVSLEIQVSCSEVCE